MCNWRAWVLPGFLTVIGLTTLAGLVRGGSIEADLTARSITMLEQDGLPWASVTVNGRDAMLMGLAPTEAARSAAIVSVQRVVGVARVDPSDLGLLPLADPYTLVLEKTANSLTVSGSFPGGEVRAALLDEMRVLLGAITLVDDSQLARGAPVGFVAQATFAAAGLPALETGMIMLDESTLSITGDAISLEAYNAELARLAAPPDSLTLGDITLNPPAISPYIWSAEATGSGVTLSGYVPDAETREAILSVADQLGSISDRMDIGSGAPDGFEAAVEALLGQMNGLENATAAINDRELSLAGEAATSEAYRSANDFLGSLPAGFDSLSGRIEPPLADPFVTILTKSEDGYALSGVLPDETARAILLDALEGQGGPIADTATVARGAPEGIEVGDLFAQTVSILSDLEEGTATLTGSSLTVAGIASSETEAQAAEATIAALANQTLSVSANITSVQAPPLTGPR